MILFYLLLKNKRFLKRRFLTSTPSNIIYREIDTIKSALNTVCSLAIYAINYMTRLLCAMRALQEHNNTPHQSVNETQVVPEDGRARLRKWLNSNFTIEMTDGRVLTGVFLCTDRDANIILGACSEYLKNAEGEAEEPRVLGLAMVPGRHIVSIQVDDSTQYLF